MKILYNPKYYEYYEIGRTELLREIGISYKSIEEYGYHLPVIESMTKYNSPGYYDDILVIESILSEVPILKIHIDYRIIRKSENKVIATGYTEHVFLKDSNRKPTRIPQFFIDHVKPFFK
jgi:acyl-CoA thioester hydrolase